MNNNKKCCPVTCLISVVAVFVFMMFYGWLVHGHLLMADYQATANLWRTPEDMKNFCAGWIAYYVIFSMVVTCFFKKFRKVQTICTCGPECQCGTNCPCKATNECATSRCPIKSGGLCFGLKLGLILGLPMFTTYFYMPIPLDLAVKWFFTGLVQGLGVGAILGIVSGKGKGTSCGATAGASCSKTSCNAKVD